MSNSNLEERQSVRIQMLTEVEAGWQVEPEVRITSIRSRFNLVKEIKAELCGLAARYAKAHAEQLRKAGTPPELVETIDLLLQDEPPPDEDWGRGQIICCVRIYGDPHTLPEQIERELAELGAKYADMYAEQLAECAA